MSRKIFEDAWTSMSRRRLRKVRAFWRKTGMQYDEWFAPFWDADVCARHNHPRGFGCEVDDCARRHVCMVCRHDGHGAYTADDDGDFACPVLNDVEHYCVEHDMSMQELADQLFEQPDAGPSEQPGVQVALPGVTELRQLIADRSPQRVICVNATRNPALLDALTDQARFARSTALTVLFIDPLVWQCSRVRHELERDPPAELHLPLMVGSDMYMAGVTVALCCNVPGVELKVVGSADLHRVVASMQPDRVAPPADAENYRLETPKLVFGTYDALVPLLTDLADEHGRVFYDQLVKVLAARFSNCQDQKKRYQFIVGACKHGTLRCGPPSDRPYYTVCQK